MMKARSTVIRMLNYRAVLPALIIWFVHWPFLAPTQAQTADAKSRLPTTHLVIGDSGFSITVPEGFKERSGTLHHEQLRASLVFAYDPRKPFAEVESEFTREVLAKQGMKLISKKKVEVNGSTGLLVSLSRTRDAVTKLGWVIALPSGNGVAQVTTIFPEEKQDLASIPMRDALLSVKHRPGR